MFNTSQPLKIAIAGSTERTAQCATSLLDQESIQIEWILTPPPQPLGRKQVITPNPLDAFATAHSIPSIHVEKKITEETRSQIQEFPQIDVLLVVDFGYLIPQWLLDLPSCAPLNIHPSLLPRWRGSSPGQFVLLFGDTHSAVTLMVMNAELDQGPLISQLHFDVQPDWTQTEYYQTSFGLIATQLPHLIREFVEQKIISTPQPHTSPTPLARRLTREDGFIEWETLAASIKNGARSPAHLPLNPLLSEAASVHRSLGSLIDHACRALSPWPGLWTLVVTGKGKQRLKILRCHQDTSHNSVLDVVQLEGKQPSSWDDVRQILTEKIA